MKYILLLSIITLISIYLGYINYRTTRNISILIGLLLIYYWTFNGAWLFVYDVLSGYHGKYIGLTYYDINKKMFPLALDYDYFLSILYYGFFFISLQITLFFILRKTKPSKPNKIFPIKLIPLHLYCLSFLSLILSYICVHHKFIEAYDTKTALYTILRHTPNRFNTLHQIFNIIAVFTAYLSLVVYLSEKNARYFILSRRKISIGIIIFLNITLLSLYFILIGNKHDLIFSGLFGFIFYFANNAKIKWKKIALFIIIIAFPLTLTDMVRGLPLLNYASRIQEDEYNKENISTPGYLNVLFNNEMFYAHFSMYGTLSKNVDLTYGKSFINLGESFIPRVIIENRSEDVYTHYANAISAKEGQGYTIHHATGWYINFGIIGLLFGGIAWGLVWGLLVKQNLRIGRVRKKFFIIVYALAPTLFVAFIPNLIRNGIEGYKAFLVEAILLPSAIVFITQFTFHRKAKQKSLKPK